MADIKITPVTKEGIVDLKESRAVESRMSALLLKRAELEADLGGQLRAVNEQINEITQQVVGKCRSFSKDFTALRMPNGINFLYSLGGTVFAIDQAKIAKIPNKLYTKRLSYSPNTKEIETWIKMNGRLPAGLKANKREGSPRLTLTGDIKAELSAVGKDS